MDSNEGTTIANKDLVIENELSDKDIHPYVGHVKVNATAEELDNYDIIDTKL